MKNPIKPRTEPPAEQAFMNREQAFMERVIAHTVAAEGGYVDHPADPGGATKHGISLRWLRRQGADLGDVDGDGDVDADDVRGIDRDRAVVFYRREFWTNDMTAMATATPQTVAKLFDLSVNTGPRQAAKLLQRAISKAGHDTVTDDGVIGERTLAAWRECGRQAGAGEGDEALCSWLIDEAVKFYNGLTVDQPAFRVFLAGWERRARTRI